MTTKLKLLSTINNQIIDLTEDDKLEDTIVEADEYTERKNIDIRILKDKIKSQQTNSGAENHTESRPASSQQRRTDNLPKIELPTFDGNVLEWTTFIDTFNSAIDRMTAWTVSRNCSTSNPSLKAKWQL
jgi:hypothetical protein